MKEHSDGNGNSVVRDSPRSAHSNHRECVSVWAQCKQRLVLEIIGTNRLFTVKTDWILRPSGNTPSPRELGRRQSCGSRPGPA